MLTYLWGIWQHILERLLSNINKNAFKSQHYLKYPWELYILFNDIALLLQKRKKKGCLSLSGSWNEIPVLFFSSNSKCWGTEWVLEGWRVVLDWGVAHDGPRWALLLTLAARSSVVHPGSQELRLTQNSWEQGKVVVPLCGELLGRELDSQVLTYSRLQMMEITNCIPC